MLQFTSKKKHKILEAREAAHVKVGELVYLNYNTVDGNWLNLYTGQGKSYHIPPQHELYSLLSDKSKSICEWTNENGHFYITFKN